MFWPKTRLLLCIVQVDRICNTMADAFAGALLWSAKATASPSQDINVQKAFGDVVLNASAIQAPSHAPIEIEDECVDSPPMRDAITCPGQVLTTPQKVTSTKRLFSQPPAGGHPRRKYAVDQCLQFDLVPLAGFQDVACLSYDGTLNGLIPLWGQYKCKWKDYELTDYTWIQVSSSQPWVKQLVHLVAPKQRSRELIQKLTSHVQTEFNASLATSLKAGAEIRHAKMHMFDESQTALKDSLVRQRSGPIVKCLGEVVQIDIGAFKVLCLNNKRQVALSLDKSTKDFITGWILPLIKFLDQGLQKRDELAKAHAVATPDELASAPGEPIVTVPGFVFSTCHTPAVRDKVVWMPQHHGWRIFPKNPSGEAQQEKFFAVNQNQAAKFYEEEKIIAYRRAITAWNQLDGSTRQRIYECIIPAQSEAIA